MTKKYRWLRRFLLVASMAIISMLGLRAARRLLLPLPTDRCQSRRFEADAWRDSTLAYSAAAVRGCMVDDLLERELLSRRSRADVVALLGEPRPTDYFREYDLVYWLGPERGLMSIDSEWLVLRLGPDGRVSEARLVTD